MRFSVLKRRIDGVSQKMLSQTLRALERDGLVARRVHAEVPPRVEYELTELGLDFANSVTPLGAFAVRNRDSIEAARREFDGEEE